ncbi:MAG: hypothetical protein PWP31_930 [Clostridia bacterium]|nr:hypothetical protein [Clostridia bacterium]
MAFLLFFLTASPVYAIDVAVNGKQVNFDVEPKVQDGRTLIPVRFVVEKLGARVTWSPSAQTVGIYKGDISITLGIGCSIAYINNERYTLETPPVIVEGRTLVPLRFISEYMGESVVWDKNEKFIYIGDRQLPFETFDGNRWVTMEQIKGKWYLKREFQYQDFAVIQSEDDYLSKPPLKTITPIKPPKNDYSKYLVLWAYLGEASTGGYGIHFQKIVRNGDVITVTLQRISPAPGVIVTQAFSYPEEFARIERSYLPEKGVFRFIDQDGKLLKTIEFNQNI